MCPAALHTLLCIAMLHCLVGSCIKKKTGTTVEEHNSRLPRGCFATLFPETCAPQTIRRCRVSIKYPRHKLFTIPIKQYQRQHKCTYAISGFTKCCCTFERNGPAVQEIIRQEAFGSPNTVALTKTCPGNGNIAQVHDIVRLLQSELILWDPGKA